MHSEERVDAIELCAVYRLVVEAAAAAADGANGADAVYKSIST